MGVRGGYVEDIAPKVCLVRLPGRGLPTQACVRNAERPPPTLVNLWGSYAQRRGEVVRSGPGLGLIAPDGGGFDAVAHRTAVRGDAEREMVTGRRVHFDLTLNATGIRADNIRPAPQKPCAPAEEAEADAVAPGPG